jgi:hypothetical protein
MKIIFEETENGILIKAMNKEYSRSLAGVLKGNGKLKEEMREVRKEEI